jgi:hypothetical protein
MNEKTILPLITPNLSRVIVGVIDATDPSPIIERATIIRNAYLLPALA